MNSQETTHDQVRSYEAIGRVMTALRDCRALSGAQGLDWWRADGAWQIEWREGPFPSEVMQMLLTAAACGDDPAGDPLRDVVELDQLTNSDNYAFLKVLGVRIVLRALDPIGTIAVASRLREAMRELAAEMAAAR